jgi:hypothetical protein
MDLEHSNSPLPNLKTLKTFEDPSRQTWRTWRPHGIIKKTCNKPWIFINKYRSSWRTSRHLQNNYRPALHLKN